MASSNCGRLRVGVIGAVLCVLVVLLSWALTVEVNNSAVAVRHAQLTEPNESIASSHQSSDDPSSSSTLRSNNDGIVPSKPGVAFSEMVALCRKRSSSLFSDNAHRHAQDFGTPYAQFLYSPNVMCTTGRRFFHGPAVEPLPMPHMNTSAAFAPIRNDLDFEEVMMRRPIAAESKRPLYFFEGETAVLLTATWNSVNWYHLLMDQVIGISHVDLHYPTFGEGIARRVVHISNYSWNTRWGKKDQEACVAFSSALSSNIAPGRSPRSLLLRETFDDAMYCFCDAVVVREHTLPRGPSPSSQHTHDWKRIAPMCRTPTKSAAVLAFKQRSAAYFGEVLYGNDLVDAAIEKGRLWANANGSGPRLLFVDRHKRKIGNSSRLQQLAREVGFRVAAVRFEELTPPQQFHLSRYADVLVGIHGMALTYVANMDGTGRWAQCRTLIELMHWVNPSKFWYYQEMAALNNITLVRLSPIDVHFGPSVVNKAREKRMLLKNVFWWGLKGFDDQTAFYDESQVSAVLRQARQTFESCVNSG